MVKNKQDGYRLLFSKHTPLMQQLQKETTNCSKVANP